MNLPNRLTIARLYLTAGFVVSMTLAWRWNYSAGLAFFVAASCTDYLDGQIARSRRLVSEFGKLMDPLADKVLMAAGFICLIPEGAIPAWAVIVIISREFLITGLRLLAASKGTVLPADKLGKHKTVWQMITVIYFLLLLSLREGERAGVFAGLWWWPRAWRYGGAALIALTLVLTLYSGAGYLWKNRRIVEC